jgi:hypothetical protein
VKEAGLFLKEPGSIIKTYYVSSNQPRNLFDQRFYLTPELLFLLAIPFVFFIPDSKKSPTI